MKVTALWCLLGILAASTANAEISYKSYKAAKAGGGVQWNFMRIYFNGAGNAYGYSNARLQVENKPPFYCVPPALALTAENYIDILETEIANWKPPLKDDALLDPMLLFGLIRTFPCKP
jgi:hypothetical protein